MTITVKTAKAQEVHQAIDARLTDWLSPSELDSPEIQQAIRNLVFFVMLKARLRGGAL